MISSPRFAALFVSGGLMAAAAPTPVGPDAVWKPPAGFREKVVAKCDKAADFGACFVQQMRAAGASAAAIAFAQRTDNQGYATSFRQTGKVGIVSAEYPFRANENSLTFFVNGQPPMIDVDDLSRIEKKDLDADPNYAALLRKYPNLAIFPADRRPGLGASAGRLRSGGQRFVVIYSLRDGCHACELVADAYVAFDFDIEGKLVSTDVVRVRPRSHF